MEQRNDLERNDASEDRLTARAVIRFDSLLYFGTAI